MKRFVISLATIPIAIVLLLLLTGPEQSGLHDEPRAARNQPPAPPAGPIAPPAPETPPPQDLPPPTLLTVAHTTSELNAAGTSANEDLLIVESLLDHFRRHHGSNPIGDNDDIVAALRGQNSRALAYLPPEHPALDAEGQLLDRWGTPYHFHALSGKHMEIRSAGPDRKLWSQDDILHSPAR